MIRFDLELALLEGTLEIDDLPEAWQARYCLLYTSDAADERSRVDLGGRRIIKKKNSSSSPRVAFFSSCRSFSVR